MVLRKFGLYFYIWRSFVLFNIEIFDNQIFSFELSYQ